MSVPDLSGSDVKACCSAAYSSAAVRFLFGERLHPGGARLTAALLDALAIGPPSHVVDVASGLGVSAIQAAARGAGQVTGVDLSQQNVAAATEAAATAGVEDRVTFITGDAEALPLGDGIADGVLCECALCTFPDKDAAVGEIARILRPGGRLALSDMTCDPSRLPDALTSLSARIACIADAEPLEAVVRRLAGAGLQVESTATHEGALVEMLDRVEARLALARLGGAEFADLSAGAQPMLIAAREAVADGTLGYASVIARRR